MFFYSEFQQIFYWLPFIGFTIGVLASMIGSGGGFFFPLILILFFQTPAQVAVATSLAASLPLCLSGTIGHFRQKNIHFRLGLLFGIAGILGAIVGAWITRLLTPAQLKTAFGFYSVFLAGIIITNTLRKKKEDGQEEYSRKLSPEKISKGSFFGLTGGIISGTFGTSGAIPVIAGLMVLRTPLRLVVGTSLFVVLVNTVSALTGHFLVGQIDLTLVFLLTSGSVIGAAIGPHLLLKVNLKKAEKPVKLAVAVLVIVSGILMIIN
jgi:uncharacterized membrane protein YfcA